MADNLVIDKNFDNPINVVKELVKKYDADILENPAEFTARFSGIAPNLKKDNSIFTIALNQGIAGYFLNAPKDKHKENVEAVHRELESLLAFDAIETIIEAICQALGWDDIVTTKSSAKKQYELGENYYWGNNGYKQDYKEAVKWAGLAARKGNADAQFRLGYCYHYGQGITQDYKKAALWYTKAANHGNNSAKCNLGCLYENGNGVTKDLKKAFELYKKSAENDSKVAQYNLANMYRYGKGTEKNLIEAVRWYLKAYDNGHKDAEKDLKKLLRIK